MLVDRSTIYLFNVKEYAFFCSLCIHDFFESNLNTFETLTFSSDIYFYHQALKNKKVNTYTFTYKSIYYYIHYFKMLLTYSTILRSTQLNVQNNLIEFLTSKKTPKEKEKTATRDREDRRSARLLERIQSHDREPPAAPSREIRIIFIKRYNVH